MAEEAKFELDIRNTLFSNFFFFIEALLLFVFIKSASFMVHSFEGPERLILALVFFFSVVQLMRYIKGPTLHFRERVKAS